MRRHGLASGTRVIPGAHTEESVRQDAVRMAQYAVRFAVERLDDAGAEPQEAVLDPKLVVRDTSAPPRP